MPKPYYVMGVDGLEGPHDTVEAARAAARGRGVVETLPPDAPAFRDSVVVLGVREVTIVTAENARDLYGAGSVLGEGLTEALSPGGLLDLPPVTIVRVKP